MQDGLDHTVYAICHSGQAGPHYLCNMPFRTGWTTLSVQYAIQDRPDHTICAICHSGQAGPHYLCNMPFRTGRTALPFRTGWTTLSMQARPHLVYPSIFYLCNVPCRTAWWCVLCYTLVERNVRNGDLTCKGYCLVGLGCYGD